MLTWSRWKESRPLTAMTVLMIAGVTLLWVVVSQEMNKEEKSMTSQREEAVVSAITVDDLAKVSRTKVFFGHQSVGMNVLDGVADVYRVHSMTVPSIEQGGTWPDQDGGFIDHAFIGENEKPALKVHDFDAKMRSGIGRQVDVAMMKFCYIDIKANTDIDALFATYRETMAALQRDFPEVTFIYVTVPLTTEQGLPSKLKSLIAGSNGYGAADNAARERLNSLIRRERAGRGARHAAGPGRWLPG